MSRRAPIATLTILLASWLGGTAQAGSTIQPGMMISTAVSECTANFVFDGIGPAYGRVFIGTAAHCTTDVGEVVFEGYERVGALTVPPMPARIGTVVGRGDPDSVIEDWALIEVDANRRNDVSPQLKGHPSLPRGTELRNPRDLSRGDLVQFSGYAQGLETQPTREQRVGVFNTWENTASVELVGPITFGDSGGPIVHIPTGRPLSLHSRFGALYTIAISVLVDKATAANLPIAVRTLDSPPVPAPPAAPAPAASPSAPSSGQPEQPAAAPVKQAEKKPATKKKAKKKSAKKKRTKKRRR